MGSAVHHVKTGHDSRDKDRDMGVLSEKLVAIKFEAIANQAFLGLPGDHDVGLALLLGLKHFKRTHTTASRSCSMPTPAMSCSSSV